MVKLLIIGDFHHKNKQGLLRVLTYLNIEYNFCFLQHLDNYINDYDIIYSPCHPIDTSLYTKLNKKFIFGPHFSVFPENNLQLINNINNNSIYIQPSEWAANVWKMMNAEAYIPVKVYAFSVDTNYFKPLDKANVNENVFIYYKQRDPFELQILEKFLNNKNIKYRLFDYSKKYNEVEYLEYIKTCKYGIWLGRHESQGFALEESLSCNVPLLVWNVKLMNQEYGNTYGDIFGNVIPYWNSQCGEYFYEVYELEKVYDIFIYKLNNFYYNPRKYILENLATAKCAEKFLSLISNI